MKTRTHHRFTRIHIACSALVSLLLTAPSHAVRVSTTGTGQVLLFPYFNAQRDNVSLISLVNTTAQGKAVRVNLRESRGGFVVAQLNVYLSAKDVWTAAVVATGAEVRLLSTDKTCTAPNLAGGLAVATQRPANPFDYSGAGAYASSEGYVEVIEMATIPNATATSVSITHVNGIAPCNRNITDIAYEPPTADLKAPSGGLTGTLSLINVAQGMLVSTAPTALENFWLTGSDAAAPRVWPANSVGPGLDSGGDKDAYLHGSSYTYRPGAATYTARFGNSLDAVSAVLMSSSIYTEHAFTNNNTIATTMVVTMPTKPYYIRPTVITPFQSEWNDATKQSCDDLSVMSYDREERTQSTPDDFIRPPSRRNQFCYTANVLPIAQGGTSPDATFLNSQFPFSVTGFQNDGVPVLTPGREGGWIELAFTAPSASYGTPQFSTVRMTDGKPEIVTTGGTLFGLPVIGFTLSQSAYRQGSPQQNYADAIPLRTQNTITGPTSTVP
jgi:hypothetical protein